MARKLRKVQTAARTSSPGRGPAFPVNPRVVWTARFCLAAACGLAAWLLWYSLTEKPMAGCGPGSPCDRVMGSSWAYWLGVPVSAPAFLTYFALLICSFAIRARKPAAALKAWTITLALSVLVVACAVWFTYLQLGVLKSLCKFCSSAHLLSLTGIILLFTQRPKSFPTPTPESKISFTRPLVAALVAFAAFGGLVAGQKLAPRKTNFLSLTRAGVQFDLREVPVLGSAENRRYIVSLFDYTCPDCQEMHAHLKTALQRFNNAFSIVSLPVPLDTNCHPQIRVTRPKHIHACEFAHIGLAVRRCGNDYFQKYDDWYFGLGHTPTVEEATAYARSITPPGELAKAMADPWVDQMIQTGVSVYEKNGADTKLYRLPELIIGNTINSGPVRDANELITILEARLPKAAAAHP